MTHRIRFYIALASLPVCMALSWNSGHTTGLKDMKAVYGSECITVNDIDAMIASRIRR